MRVTFTRTERVALFAHLVARADIELDDVPADLRPAVTAALAGHPPVEAPTEPPPTCSDCGADGTTRTAPPPAGQHRGRR